MIKLIICGDFRAQRPEIIHFDQEVKKLFSSANSCICNFEAPVISEKAKPIKKSGPVLSQSINSPKFLVENGFKIFLLANNHVMDYGNQGLQATLGALNEEITIGAGTASEAYSVRVIKQEGKRIGLLSLVHHEYGVLKGLGDNGHGAAWICSPDIYSIIVEAKRECDYLLIFPHAGVEHTAAPLPEWRALYKKYIDWGADAIIASHPHCPQGWEIHNYKPIYYSLGNFYFDGLAHDSLWYKSLAVELQIDNDITSITHFLCFDDKSGRVSLDTSEELKQYIGYANSLLKNEQEYQDYINNICSLLWPDIKYGLLRGLCGMSLKMKPKWAIRLLGAMLLGNSKELFLHNALQCESHRWVIERYLKNKIELTK